MRYKAKLIVSQKQINDSKSTEGWKTESKASQLLQFEQDMYTTLQHYSTINSITNFELLTGISATAVIESFAVDSFILRFSDSYNTVEVRSFNKNKKKDGTVITYDFKSAQTNVLSKDNIFLFTTDPNGWNTDGKSLVLNKDGDIKITLAESDGTKKNIECTISALFDDTNIGMGTKSLFHVKKINSQFLLTLKQLNVLNLE